MHSTLNWCNGIDCDPAVLAGKPQIKATRISGALILEYLRGGSSVDDALASFPHLTSDDSEAALACAVAVLHRVRNLPPADDSDEA